DGTDAAASAPPAELLPVDVASAAGDPPMNSTTCRKVRRVPRCSGLTAGAPGKRSCNAEKISTRLIESMPRSASSSMSNASISLGYPVFSATTDNKTATAESAASSACGLAGAATTGDTTGEGGAATVGGATTAGTVGDAIPSDACTSCCCC